MWKQLKQPVCFEIAFITQTKKIIEQSPESHKHTEKYTNIQKNIETIFNKYVSETTLARKIRKHIRKNSKHHLQIKIWTKS